MSGPAPDDGEPPSWRPRLWMTGTVHSGAGPCPCPTGCGDCVFRSPTLYNRSKSSERLLNGRVLCARRPLRTRALATRAPSSLVSGESPPDLRVVITLALSSVTWGPRRDVGTWGLRDVGRRVTALAHGGSRPPELHVNGTAGLRDGGSLLDSCPAWEDVVCLSCDADTGYYPATFAGQGLGPWTIDASPFISFSREPCCVLCCPCSHHQ